MNEKISPSEQEQYQLYTMYGKMCDLRIIKTTFSLKWTIIYIAAFP